MYIYTDAAVSETTSSHARCYYNARAYSPSLPLFLHYHHSNPHIFSFTPSLSFTTMEHVITSFSYYDEITTVADIDLSDESIPYTRF